MTRKNIDIRSNAKAAGVFLWEIAQALNISEPTFNRRMRVEMPQKEKIRIFTIIKQISTEKAESGGENI